MEAIENKNLTGIDKLIADAEYNRFFIISTVLIIVGCLGGINVGLGGLSSTWQLIVTVIPTMATLSFILSVAPMRLLLGTAIVSTIIDVILIIFNLV